MSSDERNDVDASAGGERNDVDASAGGDPVGDATGGRVDTTLDATFDAKPDVVLRIEPGVCTNPRPYLVYGVDTGFVECEEGFVHRARVAECPTAERGDVNPPPLYGCSSDLECRRRRNGYCLAVCNYVGVNIPCDERYEEMECWYGCTVDADCSEGEICFCGEPAGRCVPAACVTDGDCDAGWCSNYFQPYYMGYPDPDPKVVGFACQTPDDPCAVNAECGRQSCAYLDGGRVCAESGMVF